MVGNRDGASWLEIVAGNRDGTSWWGLSGWESCELCRGLREGAFEVGFRAN